MVANAIIVCSSEIEGKLSLKLLIDAYVYVYTNERVAKFPKLLQTYYLHDSWR